ncbi:hypothetical protein [Microcystis phage Mel-JY01]
MPTQLSHEDLVTLRDGLKTLAEENRGLRREMEYLQETLTKAIDRLLENGIKVDDII